MNPTHEGSGERTELPFSEEELLASVDQETMVGTVIPAEAEQQSLAPFLNDSISVIRENCVEIEAFAAEKHDPNAYFPMMNSLFRPLLLDGITMLELAGCVRRIERSARPGKLSSDSAGIEQWHRPN